MAREANQGPVAFIQMPELIPAYRQLQRNAKSIYPDFSPANRGDDPPRITLVRFRPSTPLDAKVCGALADAERRLIGLNLTVGGFGEFADQNAFYLQVTPDELLKEVYLELFEKLDGRINPRKFPFIAHCTVGHRYRSSSEELYLERHSALRNEFDTKKWPLRVTGLGVVPASNGRGSNITAIQPVAALARLGLVAAV